VHVLQLAELKVLQLRENRFKSLPENLDGLASLKVLQLSNDFTDEEKARIKAALPDTNVIF